MFGLSTVKLVVIGIIATAAIGLMAKGLFFVTGLVAENKNLTEAVAEHQVQKIAFELQAAADENLINGLQKAQIIMGQAITVTNTQFGEIRDQRDRQKRVLEGSRLGRLAAANAARMEQLSNNATQERFTQIEGIINEDL